MLSNVKVGTRLAIGLGLMILALCVIGGAAALNASYFAGRLADITEQNTRGAAYLANIEDAVWQLRYGVSQFIAVPDVQSRTEIIRDTGKWTGQIDENVKRFSAKPRSGPEEQALSEFIDNYRKYAQARPRWLELYGSGKIEEAAEWRAKTIFPWGGAMVASLAKLVALQQRASDVAERDAIAQAKTVRAVIWTIVAAAALLALVGCVLIARSITRPLAEAGRLAQRVGEGDLTVEVAPSGRDETAQLLRALGGMVEQLRQIAAEVASGARTAADTSSQIAQGNAELAKRTEHQASTLEETASSMEELASTVSLNAENARQASELAASASDVAHKGGKVVADVIETMAVISDSSRKIAEIIGVIDSIAFQTNILALNAAVEAARAGEHGRGFSVVAAEVRNLAQRSASAAKEIKTLIGDSGSSVAAGAALVHTAGQTMEQIVSSVKKVSDLIAGIASASREQSAGIEQVTTALNQIEQVVQQNAALVEQVSAATHSMNDQSDALLHSIARLRIGEHADIDQATAAMQPLRAARELTGYRLSPRASGRPPQLTSDFAALEPRSAA